MELQRVPRSRGEPLAPKPLKMSWRRKRAVGPKGPQSFYNSDISQVVTAPVHGKPPFITPNGVRLFPSDHRISY